MMGGELVFAQPNGVATGGNAARIDRERLCNDLMNTSVIAALIGGSHAPRICVLLFHFQ